MKKWIKGAIKNKGGLHSALGIPQGKDIPPSKISMASKQKGKIGRMARLAKTLKSLNK
jgi:hypothetical protein